LMKTLKNLIFIMIKVAVDLMMTMMIFNPIE